MSGVGTSRWEILEERTLLSPIAPTTLTVDDTGDDVADVRSLRGAIASAPEGATIVFAASLAGKTITLTQGELFLDKSLTISGPGADKLTISGNSHSRVFEVAAGRTVSISGLTVASGQANGGNGGNIENAGALSLSNCSILSGTAYLGGGIASTASSTLVVTSTTFSGNIAFDGGGIASAGSSTIINSTLRGNIAINLGGGIINLIDPTAGPTSRTMVLVNDTISNNKAGDTDVNDGGGLYQEATALGGTTSFANTLVAGNIGGDVLNASGAWVTSLGNNLIGQVDGSTGWVASDLTGTALSPLDARLGPLQANGGHTQTMALLEGSPAINAGNNGLAPDTDARGFPRIAQGSVDIGAYEYDPSLTASGMPLTFVRGQASTLNVASFTVADATARADDFTANITWGDGSVSTATAHQGTIVPDARGGFDIALGHIYRTAGVYAIKVTINDDGGSSTTIQSVATVTDVRGTSPSPSVLTILPLAPSVGVVFSGDVASFGVSGPGALPSDFTAIIQWGDGNVSPGTIKADGNGGFRVSGSNTFRQAGTIPVTVQVRGTGGSSVTALRNVVVSAATLTDKSTSSTFNANQGYDTGTQVLATFTDSNPNAALSGFAVSVDWGGSLSGTPWVGIVPVSTSGGVSTWKVMGNAIYGAAGSHRVTVTIEDAGGHKLTSSKTTFKVASNQGNEPVFPVQATLTGSVVVTLTPDESVQQPLGLQIFRSDGKQLLGAVSPLKSLAGSAEVLQVPVTEGENLLIQVLGQGTYGFKLQVSYLDPYETPNLRTLFLGTPSDPASIAVGDLNGGGPDIVVSSTTDSDAANVLLNNGSGIFGSPTSDDAGPGLSGDLSPVGRPIAEVDLTGDGIADLVLPNALAGDISVLVGNGDGSFQPERRFDALCNPGALVTGDFTGLGRTDLAVLQRVPRPGEKIQFAILLGRGDGTFLPPVIYTTDFTQGVGPMVVGDFTGDGKDDLIVFSQDEAVAQIFPGNGDGTFRSGSEFSTNEGVTVARAVDINGDGELDLVTGGASSGNVSIMLGRGDGTFQTPQTFSARTPTSPGGMIIGGLAVVDFGRPGLDPMGGPDGHLDIVVTTEPADGTGSAQVIMLPGLVDQAGDDAGFGTGVVLADVGKAGQIAAADFTRDGTTDLVVTDVGGVTLIFGKPLTISANTTPKAARDLGSTYHLITPLQIIAPGHEDAYYTFRVPTEAVVGSGNQVIDFSALFSNAAGADLQLQVLDAAGNVLGSGTRFRLVAQQGQLLTIHVFGQAGSDGSPSFGAYSLNIDVLLQLVSVQAESLLPGGPVTSLVLTFQGDHLDRASAEDSANYVVTWYSPDGQTSRVIPVGLIGTKSIIYAPHAEIGIATGLHYSTASCQTVTLLFNHALPAGTYVIALAPGLRAAGYLSEVGEVLNGSAVFGGHSVVSVGADGKTIRNGVTLVLPDLVMPSTSTGDVGAVALGTPFLSQLQSDLVALVDQLRAQGLSTAAITDEINKHVQARLAPTIAMAAANSPLAFTIVWFDPVSFDLEATAGEWVSYNQRTNTFSNTMGQTYVSVGGNVELVVLANVAGSFQLEVSNISQTAGGGAVLLSPGASRSISFTNSFLGQSDTIRFALTLPGPGAGSSGSSDQPTLGSGVGTSGTPPNTDVVTSDFAPGPGNLASEESSEAGLAAAQSLNATQQLAVALATSLTIVPTTNSTTAVVNGPTVSVFGQSLMAAAYRTTGTADDGLTGFKLSSRWKRLLVVLSKNLDEWMGVEQGRRLPYARTTLRLLTGVGVLRRALGRGGPVEELLWNNFASVLNGPGQQEVIGANRPNRLDRIGRGTQRQRPVPAANHAPTPSPLAVGDAALLWDEGLNELLKEDHRVGAEESSLEPRIYGAAFLLTIAVSHHRQRRSHRGESLARGK